jgi:hypothetical protein
MQKKNRKKNSKLNLEEFNATTVSGIFRYCELNLFRVYSLWPTSWCRTKSILKVPFLMMWTSVWNASAWGLKSRTHDEQVHLRHEFRVHQSFLFSAGRVLSLYCSDHYHISFHHHKDQKENEGMHLFKTHCGHSGAHVTPAPHRVGAQICSSPSKQLHPITVLPVCRFQASTL